LNFIKQESCEVKNFEQIFREESIQVLTKGIIFNNFIQAFLEDPVFNLILTDEKMKNNFLNNIFKSSSNPLFQNFINILYDNVDLNKNSIKAVSIWKVNESFLEFFNYVDLAIKAIEVCDLKTIKLFIQLKSIPQFQKKIMGERKHFYLKFIGVDPNIKSKGYGTKLLFPILKKADEDNIPIYLENSNEKNLKFYQKNGFKVSSLILIIINRLKILLKYSTKINQH
jgi:GNAT superfamily N-acetyltransferase